MQDFQLLSSETAPGLLELTLIGEVDLATVGTFRDAAHAAAASGDYRCLVIDLTRLGFIDSSGLHALTEAHKAMLATGGTTKVICAPGSIRKVFELIGLDRVLSIVNDRSELFAAAA